MDNLNDATYQIARANAVKAVAEAFMAGMNYSELIGDEFYADAMEASEDIVNDELVKLDQLRQTTELVEGAPTVFERGEECAS